MAKTMLAISMLIGAGACSSAPAPTAHRSTTTGPTTDAPTTTEATTTTEPEPPTTTTEPEPVEEAPVTTRAPRARSAPTTVPYEPPAPQGRTTRQDSDVLACIRSYEQGADGYATDTGNGYGGAYQFDQQTWNSVGGTGRPADASPAEQDKRAQMLYNSRGLQPWPTPAAMC